MASESHTKPITARMDGRAAGTARRHGKSSATISTLRLVVSDLDSDLASLFFSSRQRLFPSSNFPAVARCQRDLPGTGDNHSKPLVRTLLPPATVDRQHIPEGPRGNCSSALSRTGYSSIPSRDAIPCETTSQALPVHIDSYLSPLAYLPDPPITGG